MGKHQFFLIMVLLMLLAGCRSERAGWSTPAPEEYVTALEAYEQIRPTMLAWHGDTVVIGIGSLGGTPPPEMRPDSSGRSPRWGFDVYFPSAGKRTSIDWTRGEITIGIDGSPGYEVSMPGGAEGLPLGTMIDSNDAMGIALKNGADLDWILLQINIDRYDSATDRYLPPSWGLTFANPEDVSQERRVIIDAVTGEVLRNDFAGL